MQDWSKYIEMPYKEVLAELIAEGYQARMASDLLKSFLEASQKNKKANGDLSDEDF